MDAAGVAIVPVRTRGAKLRLAHVLDRRARLELLGRMYVHVRDVLARCGLRVVTVGDDELTGTASELVPDPGRGLNAAVRAGLLYSGLPALVVPADLPWLSTADVDALLGDDADVVVARSRDGGTNALHLRAAVRPSFGGASASAHAADARGRGLRARVVSLHGFEDDLDDESDLRRAIGIAPALGGSPV